MLSGLSISHENIAIPVDRMIPSKARGSVRRCWLHDSTALN
jgi:hypothetical protein